MPPGFAGGLDVWSRGDGTPGSDIYENAGNAALEAADPDFGTALRLQKTENVQKLRYTGKTPILPGCYLRVSARIKAVSGNLPVVRIAGWAGQADESHLQGVDETGPEVALQTYGEIIEVSAIIGTGARPGVDMPWGRQAAYGHFGLDLTGASGGVVLIDDIHIEDVTRIFLRDLVSLVDVRDFGALGDGAANDHAAFEAADAAAQGRRIIVPAGTYYLGESTTIQSPIRFEGKLVMPEDKVLALTHNYNLDSYAEAFGDYELAFKKAFQALYNNAGHESLDLCGRLIGLRSPVDMAAAVANKDIFKQRRVIRNGQFSTYPTADWDTVVVTSQASYDPDNPKRLTGVVDVENVPVGALIEGQGVGREVYVYSKNVTTQEITLSAPLFDAAGTQVFTFRRFQYIFDFSGFEQISKLALSDIEFQCSGRCSAILLPPTGTGFNLRDCFLTNPGDRGITSHGEGDQGLIIDNCQFISGESAKLVTERQTIALNANANDVKIRNNRAVHFLHFAVLGGSSSVILGNHIFQGDNANPGPRVAGIVLTRTNNRGTISTNYICDCSVEWSNEHDAAPGFASEFSFSALSLTGNVFLSQGTALWFTFVTVKPHGSGHFIDGLSVADNSFRLINGPIERIESIDTSFADMDYSRFRNIRFEGNSFNHVNVPVQNPLIMEHAEATRASVWNVQPAPHLPFGAWAQHVEAVTAAGPIEGAGGLHYNMPYVEGRQGAKKDQIKLHWGKAVKGKVLLRVRMDQPL